MRGEEGLAVLGEVVLVRVEEAVEPGEPVAHAVVRVEDDRDAVELGELAHLERSGDAAGDGGLVGEVALGDRFACHELPAAAGDIFI